MKIPYLLSFFIILLTTSTLAQEPKRLAPGYTSLPFQPVPPGSYSLPKIGPAADGDVLTIQNQGKHLHELMGDKLVLLSFIYASCSDINGCPLATQVLHNISRQLQKQQKIKRYFAAGACSVSSTTTASGAFFFTDSMPLSRAASLL